MLTKYLWVFFVSMVPLVELRGSIIISQGLQLPVLSSYIVAIIGNMLPVPVIYLFARKVLVWGADKPVIGKFFSWCLEKGEKGGKKLQEKAGRGRFYLLAFRFREPVHGQEHWRPVFWTWILNQQLSPSCSGFCLQELL